MSSEEAPPAAPPPRRSAPGIVLPPIQTVPELAKLDMGLETARLTLRPLAEEDVEDLWPWVSDPAFVRGMSWKEHVDREETRAYVRLTAELREKGAAMVWAVVHEGKACGCVGLDGFAWSKRAWRMDQAELGYWLARSLWGQGLATEAAGAVVRFAFNVVGLHKVTVGCVAENEASKRVIEKLGFRYVGKLEDDVWRDGRWMSRLRYEMLAHELVDDTTSTRRFVRR